MDEQLLERAHEAWVDELDSAIRSLTELHLSSAAGNITDSSQEANAQIKTTPVTIHGEDASSENVADLVELFVREMMSASDMDDARNRASNALNFFEKSVFARATAEAAQGLQKENNMLREKLQALIQVNTILKRAVSIQHERQKQFEVKNQELHNLKQMLSQCQDQLRTLEVNNYALTLHLKQAQQTNFLPGPFPPDVF